MENKETTEQIMPCGLVCFLPALFPLYFTKILANTKSICSILVFHLAKELAAHLHTRFIQCFLNKGS